MTLKDEIREFLSNHPGMTDREITNFLRGRSSIQQPVNQACRELEQKGVLKRVYRDDGLIGNYFSGNTQKIQEPTHRKRSRSNDVYLSEDEVKEILVAWLEQHGWTVTTAWGQQRGADCVADKAGERWIIEVKGCGSRQPMRVNYFLAILGELLQRMDDPNTYYSIALPEINQFEGLWRRLPELAKSRTGISAIFVGAAGRVRIEN